MASDEILEGFLPSQDSSETAATDVVEISGSIKWFDVSKGYGFIVPDIAGVPDILLHECVTGT